MNKKAIIIVLDSVGIGELPDAANYGDKGADTLGHIINPCHRRHDKRQLFRDLRCCTDRKSVV